MYGKKLINYYILSLLRLPLDVLYIICTYIVCVGIYVYIIKYSVKFCSANESADERLPFSLSQLMDSNCQVMDRKQGIFFKYLYASNADILCLTKVNEISLST